jgi:membrane protease YdiL (CAAX protease family)
MTVIKRHPLITFFVLAYALAWGALPWNSYFAPGALIAAIVTVALTQGWAGLREVGARLIRWRVSWIWYVLAVAVPLAVQFATVGLNMAFGAPALALSAGIPLAIALHIVNPTNGPFSEEPSFRGYALPELQKRRSRLGATAILAVLVAGWHVPLTIMPVFGLHPFEFVSTVAVTFWYSWLFNRSGGSSLIPLIAHGTEGTVGFGSWTGADDVRRAWIYLVLWSLVAIGLVVFDRRFWMVKPVGERRAGEDRVLARQ